MKKFQYSPFVAIIGILFSLIISCSNDEEDVRKYGTYVRTADAVFSLDQDSCPYLPVPTPTYSESELKEMLIGYKWVEVKDSTYKIEVDGTSYPIKQWYWWPFANAAQSYYIPKDLFFTDTCLYYFYGNYDWRERMERNEPTTRHLERIRLTHFDNVGYHWFADQDGKHASIFRIVYIDGKTMIAIRWFEVMPRITDTNPYTYCMVTYQNEGPSHFIDTLVYAMDSIRNARWPKPYEASSPSRQVPSYQRIQFDDDRISSLQDK